jgi:hypothetical protein
MNERIRELAEQATTIEVISGRGYDETQYINRFDKEKFAHVLLSEVMTTINNMDRYSGDRDVDDIAEALARHFGVK